MSKVLRLDKPLLKGLNIYLILHIFEYLDFQIGINSKNAFELQVCDTRTHVPASPHCLYGKWGRYFKKVYFLWKSCKLVIVRLHFNNKYLQSQLSKDLELFDCLNSKTNKLCFMLLYFLQGTSCFLSNDEKYRLFSQRRNLCYLQQGKLFVVSNCDSGDNLDGFTFHLKQLISQVVFE